MYLQHFGLAKKPFEQVPDPEFLFLSEKHEAALASIGFAFGIHDSFVIITGEIGSGKTTLARELSSGGCGVRFTLDELMLRLHPDLNFESVDYGEKAAEVREVIWTIAEQILVAGVDVILDWNSWSVARRSWVVERASAIGAPVLLHTLTASLEVASNRVQDRTASGARFAHPVTTEGNQHLASLMEEPSNSEGMEIHRY